MPDPRQENQNIEPDFKFIFKSIYKTDEIPKGFITLTDLKIIWYRYLGHDYSFIQARE